VGVLASLCVFAQSSGGGSTTGKLISPADQPLPGLIALTNSSGTIVRRVPASPAGVFRFESIAAGKYRLCGRAVARQANTERPYPDSCEWPEFGASVTVPAGGGTVTADLNVPYGRLVVMKVNDPLDLPRQKLPGGVSDLFAGVRDSVAIQHPAWVTAVSKGVREYAVVIPAATALQTVVRSGQFRVANDQSPQHTAGELTETVGAGELTYSAAFSLSRR